MQVSRSVSEHRRRPGAIAHRVSEFPELSGDGFVRAQVGEEREVVALFNQRDDGVGVAGAEPGPRRLAQREADAVWQGEIGRGIGQPALRLVGVQQHVRRILRLLHVRLVERIDLKHRAENRRRDLPAHEFSPEGGGFGQLDFDRRTQERLVHVCRTDIVRCCLR